ncbi:hypothetical protein QQF64_001661 [Cirrhinus molitorella]|uniref:Uncharacterized protein n=1 Tax=Cirrhinus molitorella TaxID=172907 RepID=A0ABR3P0S1_9TELE
MLLKRCLTAVISAICISTVTGVGSGQDLKKAVGKRVSFGPTNINPPVTSIIWKHRSSSDVIKAIEWDIDDGFSIPNPRFKDITTLDEKTGQITITTLALIHSGVYTIDINSREQEERFTLKVEKPVPKPEIEIERSSNPDVVNLRCRYNETIIWKNAAGETLTGSTNLAKRPGEFITVENTGNPENFYTCTLNNDVSEKTSDRVYERDLFKEPVPKPEIEIERSSNPDVVYLRCRYNETIIWKNAAGETLKGFKDHLKGEFIKVEKQGNPENFYTCTLKNDVSEKTSDPVYERDLFKEPVPKPEIEIERSSNPDVVNLRCRYNETIIWKNAAGEKLKGSKNHLLGEFIKVENTGNPENFYTCTLKNDVSEKTSDPVYERDLFKGSNGGLIAGIIILVIILIVAILICVYLLLEPVYNRVNKICPCLQALLDRIGCCTKRRKEYNLASTDNEMGSGSSNQGQKSGEETPALAE